MDIWNYEQTDFPTAWKGALPPEWFALAGDVDEEETRNLWAVSVRGRVFAGFETRKEARDYGKRIEAGWSRGPWVDEVSVLPDALADYYRKMAREAGYFYSAPAGGWVKDYMDSHTSGWMHDGKVYASAKEVVWDSLEPELQTILELLEENMEDLLASARKAHPEYILKAPAAAWKPGSGDGLMSSSTPPPSDTGRLKPFCD